MNTDQKKYILLSETMENINDKLSQGLRKSSFWTKKDKNQGFHFHSSTYFLVYKKYILQNYCKALSIYQSNNS